MKRVRYARPRPGYKRTLRTKDLDQLGIEHKNEDLTWSPENRFEVVLSNKMSESLVAKLPGEFVLFDTDGEDEAPEVEERMTSLADSITRSGEGFSDDPVSDSGDDDESSTSKKSRNR